MRVRLIILFGIWISVWGQNGLAQNENIRFVRLSIEQGLSQSSVLAFCQDKKGFIWLGTADGLNRYDGYDFRIYRRDLNNLANSLPNNQISALLADRSGNIWVGTGGGLSRFDPETETFQHFIYDPDSLPFSKVLHILEDREGFLWFSTLERGLKRYDPRTQEMKIYQKDSKNPDAISYNAVYGLTEAPDGKIWIGTGGGGVNIFDKKTGKFSVIRHNPDSANSLSSDIAGTIAFSKNGKEVWIGSYGAGLNCLDLQTGKFRHFRHDAHNPFSLSDDRIDRVFRTQKGEIWICTEKGLDRMVQTPDSVYFIRYQNEPANTNSIGDSHALLMYEDSGGVLWVGTYVGGANRFDPKKKKFGWYRHHLDNPQSLSSDVVRSVFEDRDRNLWINTTQGGLNKITYADRLKNNQIFKLYLPNPADPFSLSSEKGANVFQDSEGRIWVGTNGEGLNLYQPEKDNFIRIQHQAEDSLSLPNNRIRAIFEDSKKRLWLGTLDGLCLFDPITLKIQKHYKAGTKLDKKQLSHYHLRQIVEDKEGMLWIATDGGGLNQFDPENEVFTHYLNNPNDKTTISDNRVNCLYLDEEGIIWAGTSGGGLNRFDPKTEKFNFFVEEDGLANNVVYGILPDNRGNLWISTNRGLSKFNLQTRRFRNFDANDGLQSNEFNLNAFGRSASGELFFGGIGGLTYFYPDSIHDNPYQAPIELSDFKIKNKSVPINKEDSPLKQHIAYTEEITLSYQENNFTIEFAALHYGTNGKKQYQYRLLGYQDEWIETDERRPFASFTNLPEGTYTFEVRGTNTDGIWSSKIRTLQITIHPPFWASAWFITFCILVLIISALGFYRLRINQIKAQKLMLEELIKLRTREVESQKEALEAQNKDIKASIQYAKTIQEAMLLSEKNIQQILPELFVFLKPRDIVSGDFYWIGKIDNKMIIIAADCTGHGVPGAFMSLIGNDLLNEIIKVQQCTDPQNILAELHHGIQSSLKQTENNNIRDGMEIAIVVGDQENQCLTFAGAGLPLVYCKDQKLHYVRGNTFGVGGSQNPKTIQFLNHTMPYQNTTFYLYSDGYQDQFGGENKKYMSKRFKELLHEIHLLPMPLQKEVLEAQLRHWQGDYKQVDDILVIGFRL